METICKALGIAGMRWVMLAAVFTLHCSLCVSPVGAQSQCGIENTAFKSGERLTYNRVVQGGHSHYGHRPHHL